VRKRSWLLAFEEEARLKRKIAAILAADVVEYSRLVAEDEEETLRRLVSYRSVFDDFVTKAEGRIFNTAGDAVLAEFPSAVDALRAAIDIQESLRTRNMAYPPSRHMQFRMGLTVGDVVEREGDLLGDGVNIAARLQGLAVPGGICVSRSVHEQVANKLSVLFRDLGPQEVKNIPAPVYVYRVDLGRDQERSAASMTPVKSSERAETEDAPEDERGELGGSSSQPSLFSLSSLRLPGFGLSPKPGCLGRSQARQSRQERRCKCITRNPSSKNRVPKRLAISQSHVEL
jgi:class 3 adenylate cyclase